MASDQFFKAIEASLLFSKNDSSDLRCGDLVLNPNLQTQNQWSILGYPDDEGIRLNGGRVGAAKAPEMIRRFFYKMTPSFLDVHIQDHGDLQLSPSLEERHQISSRKIKELFLKNQKVLTLGGGHDYGFPDADGFLSTKIKNSSLGLHKPVVINFDAHMDVRPTDKGLNSGTPFRRLLEKYHQQFHFIEVGIQPQCNSVHHTEWAKQMGASILDIGQIEKYGMQNSLQSLFANLEISKNSPLWISVDIDGFTQSEAPGCSQSWLRGFSYKEFRECISWLLPQMEFSGVGIYEVSPELDQDHRTSKLAALIMYDFIFAQGQP